MGILKNIFKPKETPIKSYDDFWKWFSNNERLFHKVIKEHEDVEKNFFNKLSPKLNELKEGFWYEVGMYDNDTAELIITADGVIKNIVFVEELMDTAPKIEGWKLTALKPALDIRNVNIEMGGHKFTRENLHFCINEQTNYPDEIDISIVHNDCVEENKSPITSGVYIFLDNYLGELDFAMVIDNLKIATRSEINKELIPIEKLKDYLKWRQSEFIEKYEDTRHDTENDEHSVLKAYHEDNSPLIAVINTDLLNWDSKASHPWVLKIEIPYKAGIGNGMPDDNTRLLLDEIESDISSELKDIEGYLYIGRQTTKNIREIYFACTDFRKPSNVLYKIQKKFEKQFAISYDIYKDKYWQSFNRFKPAL
ncbi:MAG: DUF695 domain-containing protein [Bacteroidota bacterium]